MAAQPMDYKQWLAKLVAFDTTSRNSNLELIHYCKDYLEGLGVRCTLVHNAEKTKANLWATLPGEGGVTEGGIILSGHTDVVPVDGQKWDTDPFKLAERDGKLYGRGTCDMKGFIALAMSLTPEFLRIKRLKPIHYAWSFDEEVGCLGAKALAEFFRDKGIKADGCIIGEPTDLAVYTGHKGMCIYEVRFTGKAVHSSYALTNQGCNAIDYAAKMIVKLREMAEEMRDRGPWDDAYVVPFTTMSTNFIKGGNAVNTVPAECLFNFEFRNMASTNAAELQERIQALINKELLPAMKAECPEANIEATFVGPVPCFEASDSDFISKLSRRLLESKNRLKGSWVAEGGYFQGCGIPTVIAGPGSALCAHRANEYVDIKEMDRCRTFLLQIAETLSHSGPHL